MPAEYIVGIGPHLGDQPMSIQALEHIVGKDVLTVLMGALGEGDELAIAGSTAMVGLEGAYVVNETGDVPVDRSSDIDVYVSPSTYERLLTCLPECYVVKDYSTEAYVGGRKLDIINVEETAVSWRAAIEDLLHQLGEGPSEEHPIVSLSEYTTSYPQEVQDQVRSYMRASLTRILVSLENDPTPTNFLRHNGLTTSEALSISLTHNEGEVHATVNDPTLTLHSRVSKSSRKRQLEDGTYKGVFSPALNEDSLNTVLLYASLLDSSMEVSQNLLPYKIGTSVSRLVRMVGERKNQLASMYQTGEDIPIEEMWFNALYRTAERLVNGDPPLKVGDANEQAQLDEIITRKMQEEFARAASRDLSMAVSQMFLALPLSGFVADVLERKMESYHANVLPNTLHIHNFIENNRLRARGDIPVEAHDSLQRTAAFISNIGVIKHLIYPSTRVDMRMATDLSVESGLMYTRQTGPASMSEAMALMILALKAMHWDSDVNIEAVCNGWHASGTIPNTFNTSLNPDFDMGMDTASVRGHLGKLEAKLIEAIDDGRVETPHL